MVRCRCQSCVVSVQSVATACWQTDGVSNVSEMTPHRCAVIHQRRGWCHPVISLRPTTFAWPFQLSGEQLKFCSSTVNCLSVSDNSTMTWIEVTEFYTSTDRTDPDVSWWRCQLRSAAARCLGEVTRAEWPVETTGVCVIDSGLYPGQMASQVMRKRAAMLRAERANLLTAFHNNIISK